MHTSFRPFVFRGLALAALVLLFAFACAAQTGDGEIAGLIKDPSGSAIPSASVNLTNEDTGVSHTIATDAEGRYLFYPVPPGRYALKVEVTGFKTTTLNDIQMTLGTHINRDITMAVGSVQESVAVTGEVPPIDVSKNDVSGVVSNQQIENLPI